MALTPVTYIPTGGDFTPAVANGPHDDLKARDEEIYALVSATSGDPGIYTGYHSKVIIDCNEDETLSILENSEVSSDDGNKILIASTDLTVDITLSGVGGLDTGAEAVDTWYYIWMIGGISSSAGLLSLSSTAPTMPSGYTYKRLIGAVKNGGDGHFERFLQQGNSVVYYDDDLAIISTSNPATTLTTVSGSDYLPDGLNIRQALIKIYMEVSWAATDGSRCWTRGGIVNENLRSNVISDQDPSVSEYWQPVDVLEEFDYRVEDIGWLGNWEGYAFTIIVQGYKFPL